MAKAKTNDIDDGTDNGPDTTPSPAPVAQVRPKKAPAQLVAHEIQPEGIKWSRWAVFSKEEHAIEDVLAPGYLWGKHDQIRGGDYIEIKHPLGLFVVCLDVVRVDVPARGIVAHVRNIYDFTAEGGLTIAPTLEGATVQDLGGKGWSITEGHHIVAEGFHSEAAARKWLAERRAA